MAVPVPTGDWDAYLWIVITGALAACFMAWGIGANDVANAFATSVGSRTLTLWQACIIAGIFEFLGAMVLGGETTKTISSDIANVKMFNQFPEMYMYGMLCALSVAGTWLLVATYWCLAVSTTHSIIGAVMGFSLVYGGINGVIWSKQIGTFPYVGGFLPVVLSWFFSPIIGGTLGAIIFNLCRFCILRRQNSTNLAIYSIPVLIFITFFINLIFVLAKGASAEMKKRWPCTTSIGYHGIPYTNCTTMYNAATWISASVAGGLAVIGGAIIIPLLKRKVAREAAAAQEAALAPEVQAELGADVEKMAAMEGVDKQPEGADKPAEGTTHTNWDGSVSRSVGNYYQSMKIHEVPQDASALSLPLHYSKRVWSSIARQAVKGLTYDVHSQVQSSSQQVMDMHANAEVFKPETERIFQWLQVLSSCCVAFAHGSNDVANSIGPFSAIFTTYQTHKVPTSKTDTPKWIFAMGSSLLVIGLLTYGYNIIMTLGVQLLKLTPSRGFSAELAAGLTISLASFYGIPVSTTQIIVGAETGVALCESIRHGANWLLLLKTFLGWIWTIILALGFCACLFSMGAFAPSINMQYQIYELNFGMYNVSKGLYNTMAAANKAANVSNPSYWTDPTWKPQNGSKLAATISIQNSTYFKVVGAPYTGAYMTPPMSFYYFNQALSLYQGNSKSTIGVNQTTA